MPVEIVTTNPSDAEIRESDLKKMKDDFINQADVKPFNGRNRLIKKFSVSLMKDEIKELIRYYEDHPDKDIHVIKINFAIHINPFNSCNGDYSDSLTAVVEAAKFIDNDNPPLGHISYIKPGDFVVIPGYKSVNKNGWAAKDPCCPSSNP